MNKLVTPEHDVFHGAYVGEKFDVLEGSGDAQSSDFIRFLTLDFLILEVDTAVVGPIDPVNAVKKRCFACTVGPYNSKYRTFEQFKADIAEGGQAPEGYGKIFNLEKRHPMIAFENELKPVR